MSINCLKSYVKQSYRKAENLNINNVNVQPTWIGTWIENSLEMHHSKYLWESLDPIDWNFSRSFDWDVRDRNYCSGAEGILFKCLNENQTDILTNEGLFWLKISSKYRFWLLLLQICEDLLFLVMILMRHDFFLGNPSDKLYNCSALSKMSVSLRKCF